MKTKRFPFRVLLTVTTGRLLVERKGPRDNGIGDLYEILGWMTNDSPFTHQLPRFSNECSPWLLRWFPELAQANDHLGTLDTMLDANENDDTCEKWLGIVKGACGLKDEYDVPKIPRDDHDIVDPVAELEAMVGDGQKIVVVETDNHDDE